MCFLSSVYTDFIKKTACALNNNVHLITQFYGTKFRYICILVSCIVSFMKHHLKFTVSLNGNLLWNTKNHYGIKHDMKVENSVHRNLLRNTIGHLSFILRNISWCKKFCISNRFPCTEFSSFISYFMTEGNLEISLENYRTLLLLLVLLLTCIDALSLSGFQLLVQIWAECCQFLNTFLTGFDKAVT